MVRVGCSTPNKRCAFCDVIVCCPVTNKDISIYQTKAEYPSFLTGINCGSTFKINDRWKTCTKLNSFGSDYIRGCHMFL